ncbi:MAG: polysaccharide deacetylase family protein [Candidatus Binatia bacterium]
MIDVLGSTDRRRFGLEAALGTAGVPLRVVARPAPDGARPLLVALDAPDVIVAELRGRRPLIVVGAAPGGTTRVRTTHGTIALDAAVWPPALAATARRLGLRALRLPRVRIAIAPAPPPGEILATVRDDEGHEHPAIVAHGGVVWCPADLGEAFADLLDEGYLAETVPPPPSRSLLRPVLALYYRAPEELRSIVQRRAYARLARALAARAATGSDYPVDATGWLLGELVAAIVRRAAGGLVRIAPWPAPFGAAAALTHDVEPTRYSYGPGLRALLGVLDATGHPATLGLVAGRARRHLDAAAVRAISTHEVLCHGLEHQGETLVGTREQVAAGITTARTWLEATLGRPIEGFRSPRLDRSAALLWALDHAGYRWDSSFPDVDRENVARFGAGVRLGVPYRPPLAAGDGSVRASRCLELPVSAPDCIQPLFGGDDLRALRRAVRTKVDFVRATGGLYTAIVHGGVFGPRDSARRAAHLRFVARLVRQPDVWLARPSAIADWWSVRERLVVDVGDGWIEVTNGADRVADGVRLVVDGPWGEIVHAVPLLAPGARVRVATAPAGAAPRREEER